MPNRVIHISEEVHKLVKDHCSDIGCRMSVWTNEVLVAAVTKGTSLNKVAGLVERNKRMTTLERTESDGPQPWELPPFWQGKKEQATEETKDPQEGKRKDTVGRVIGDISKGAGEEQSGDEGGAAADKGVYGSAGIA